MLFPSPGHSQYEDSMGVLYKKGSFSVIILFLNLLNAFH